jgi:hypothetical protein
VRQYVADLDAQGVSALAAVSNAIYRQQQRQQELRLPRFRSSLPIRSTDCRWGAIFEMALCFYVAAGYLSLHIISFQMPNTTRKAVLESSLPSDQRVSRA